MYKKKEELKKQREQEEIGNLGGFHINKKSAQIVDRKNKERLNTPDVHDRLFSKKEKLPERNQSSPQKELLTQF